MKLPIASLPVLLLLAAWAPASAEAVRADELDISKGGGLSTPYAGDLRGPYLRAGGTGGQRGAGYELGAGIWASTLLRTELSAQIRPARGRSIALFADAFLETPAEWDTGPFRPFVGLGAGWQRLGHEGAPAGSGRPSGLAGRVTLGTGIQLTRGTVLDLFYRFTAGPRPAAAIDGSGDSRPGAHEWGGALRTSL